MATNPTPEVLAALRAAAHETNVPLSLLWGVAFAESSFEPSKVGPITRSGERALGLMQLMPRTAAAYGVADPMNARQNALGGARMLAKLGKALKWDWAAMLAAYNWGATNYARAQTQGEAIPGEVTAFVRRALAARDVYRNKASKPVGALYTQALGASIEALAALNPDWAPAVLVRDAWRTYYSKAGDSPDAHAAVSGDVKNHWRGYQLAYERAPITDETTPTPEQIEPSFWQTASQAVDAATEAAKRFAKRAGDVAGDAALGLGAGIFVLALFLFTVGGGRRR